MDRPRDIVIVGGGLAGLISSILLRKAGLEVTLVEQKEYPFHKVCGEYISNEVKPFLQREHLFPEEFHPPNISRFQLTSTSGHSHSIDLPLGGFGISRYHLDQFLAQRAKELGTEVMTSKRVMDIGRMEDHFIVEIEGGTVLTARLVIGSFGKRSKLDQALDRSFFQQKSPYLAVKYHLKTDHPADLISLHNFKGGYCGISKIEQDKYNLCYLSHRDNLKRAGSIPAMENEVLSENPFLKNLLLNSDVLFDKPLTINEISFRPKSLVENGILMCGDSAGMITPLCGNGMAMAIHSAKILSDAIIAAKEKDGFNQPNILSNYSQEWRNQFGLRLKIGRTVQRLFGGKTTSMLAVQLLKTELGSFLVSKTHGQEF